MNNISILGCGWLGKPLAVSLLEDGFSVKGSTTSEIKIQELEALEIEAYLVDITEFEEFDSFLQSDILIIAITSKDIDAFERLIEQIQTSTIQKVIFISSTSVYPVSNAIVSEETQTLKTPLAEIENLFKENTFFETTIIRFAGLFGPGRHPGSWFKNGRTIPQPNGLVNMIHQEDCIEIIHEIIDQNCWNITLNACSNDHPTRSDFYINARKSLNFEAPVFEGSTEIRYKIISSKKLQKVLDYQFIHDDLLNLNTK
ncbi:MAG: NAD(P)-binding domain-containing protein [Flavobacteriaceae bacterium]